MQGIWPPSSVLSRLAHAGQHPSVARAAYTLKNNDKFALSPVPLESVQDGRMASAMCCRQITSDDFSKRQPRHLGRRARHCRRDETCR